MLSCVKMAPRMAAVVWNAPVLLMFLFVCSVFSHSITISFTRDELLDITHRTIFFQIFCLFRCFVGCSDVTTLKKMCSPNLEALFINCKPFYSPREFSSFILVNVYVPPDACVSAAMQQLAKQISEMEQRYPDSLLIILGDFNKSNLSRELPKYR